MQLFYSKTSQSYYLKEKDKLMAYDEHYLIKNEIPRFVPSENYAQAFGNQWNRFQTTQLDSEIGFSLSEERLKRCLGEKLWNGLEGKMILEAGCGAGRFTEILLKKGAIVVSVDLSEAVEANQRNFPQTDKHFICQADIGNLPFQYNFFDIVLCLGVVQHTKNSEETIRTLFKYVRSSGSLVFDHYRRTLSFVTRLLPVYRRILRAIKIRNTLQFTEKLVNLFFPMHKIFGKSMIMYAIISRVSPIVTYFHRYPQLNEYAQKNWAIMDTHDSLFDYYKHLKNLNDVKKILKNLNDNTDIICVRGGIGIEARCVKTANSQVPNW